MTEVEAGSDFPRRIGPYTILDRLGEGGAAIVYLAEQHRPFRRRVALKHLKTSFVSPDSVSRFELELKTMARLQHENIAQVYDYQARGRERPYFTMEFVEGENIMEFSDRLRLTTRARVELFLSLVEAVGYIHRNGVIHRDLKPTNVLVRERESRPQLKLIDFGLAKLSPEYGTSEMPVTDEGGILGTLAYMSPEQAGERSLDTRADIYSLGALLHELLTGLLPLDPPGSIAEVPGFLERLEDEIPSPASSRVAATAGAARLAEVRSTTRAGLMKGLRQGLDHVLSCCLAKDPEDRYPTAEALSTDLRACLLGESPSAGPPSALGHLRQRVRRHPKLVVAALLVVIILASAAALSAFWHLRLGAEHDRRVMFLQLGEAVQVQVANAHLWLEEALADDPSIDLAKDVFEPVDRTEALVQTALSGGESSLGSFPRAEDDELTAVLGELGRDIEEFARVGRTRWLQRRDRGSIGAALDTRCDELYRRILLLSSQVSIVAGRTADAGSLGLGRSVLVINLAAALVGIGLLLAVARSRMARRRGLGPGRGR